MPAAIPFVIGAAAAAGTGMSISATHQQKKAAKSAAAGAEKANNEAIAQVKAAQNTASTQAVESIRKRTSAMSQTVYTSPLGLSGQAEIAKKTLLGI